MRKIHFVRAIALIVACGILVAEATGAPGARDARGSHPDSHAFNPAVGASIESEDGRAELGIPPGAFAAGFPIGLTPLPPWALPEPLPLGWSPHYVLRLGPVQHTPRSPLKLRLPAPEREDFVVALLDADSGRWQRVAAQAAEGSLSVQLSHLGTLAVLLPDPGDQTPAIPEDGNPLQGVVATPTPALEKMELSVTPENLFLGNAAEVRVSARVATDSGLPSGSRIAVRILERYDLLDGGHLLPEPRYQELVLYRDHEGLSGNALVFADSALEPGRVRDGRIDVKVVPADALPIRIKAETAGANVTTWGAELQLRSGISAAFAAASPDTEFLPGLEGLEPLADLWLELDAQAVVKPPVLSIPVPAGYPREGTCLVARVSSIQGRSHYQLAGVARPTQGRLVLETGDGAPNWPGIVQGGRYLFLLHKGPMAYVTGQVGRVGNESVEPVLVMAQGLPLVDLVAPGRGDYALALLLSPQRLSATDLGNGAEIGIDVAPDKRDQLLTLDLELAPRGPTLLTSEPVDEASGVSLRPIVKLGFDRSLSQADVTPETVRLLSGNESVGLNLELAADGRSLYLRPNLPLAEKTGYRLELGTGLKDRYGNHLQDAPRQIAFTTLDDTPPPMPEPGQIEVGVLTADRAPVTGGVGATEPGTLVYVKNSGSQQIESVLSGEDGSFSLEIAASLTDDLEMTLRDQAGNEQQMALGRPKPPPGMGVLGAEGGQVTTQEGVRLRFPTDVMPTDSIVHMKSLPTEEFPTPFSSAMPGKVLGAVDLDLGGAEIPGVASLELRVGGLPQFNVSDNIPLFRIEQDLALPMDLKPGQKIKIRLRGQDVAGRLTRLETVLEIVAPEDLDTQQARPRSLEQSGSPTLKMTLPQRAAPGQTVRIAAAADPPYIKLGFPLNGEELTGKEQFLAFEVRNEGEHWFWDLTDIAELRTDADGDRLVETSSPPYRGIRKDRSSLILVMFYQTSVSFMQVMQRTSPTNSYGTIDSLRDLRNGESPFMPMVTIGASMAQQLRALNPVMRSLYEFSVIPVRAGVPGTIQIVDPDSNRETYRMEVDALPPGAMASVVVLGEDENPLKVTGTSSQNNHSVPLDAALSVHFSHVVDSATVKGDTLYFEDDKGNKVDAEIRFHERGDLFERDPEGEYDRAFIARVKPLHRLKAGRRYHLVATTGIQRPGKRDSQRMREDFRMPFTTAPPPQVVGRLGLQGARSFDILNDTAILAQTDIPAGLNTFVTADISDPVRPKVLAEVPFKVDKSGPLWAVRGLPDVHFKNRKGLAVRGDLAVLSLGNGGVFSTVRALDITRPEKPKALTNAIVSLPLDVIHEKAKLVVIPTLEGFYGPSLDVSLAPATGALGLGLRPPGFDMNLHSVEVREAYGANTTGIPQTTAIPHTIDTQDSCRGKPKTVVALAGRQDRQAGKTPETEPADTCWVYFVNQGLGVMTLDLGRSVPPPPPNLRGERFGPSYLPKDKTGALVFRDDPSMVEMSEGFEFSTPAHLSFVGAKVRITGRIRDQKIDRVLINGFPAKVRTDAAGKVADFEVEIPLREGANAIHADAFHKGGGQVGSIRMWLLRNYDKNPLAGNKNIGMDLPALQVVVEPELTVTARVSNVKEFDEILVNGRSASAKKCPPYARTDGNDCGWEGVGTVKVPLEPGINSIVATAIEVDEEFPQSLYYADLRVQEGLALAVKEDLFLFDASGVLLINTVPIGSAHRVSVVRGVHVDVDGDGRIGLEETEDGDEITQFDELKNLALVGERGGRLTFVDITEPHKAKVIGRMPFEGPVFRAEYLRKDGIALVAAGDSVLLVDLARAALKEGLLDADGDGYDDRILERVELPGAQDLRLDEDKELVYVLQRGRGMAMLRLGACQQDLGVDATFVVKERQVRYATLAQERAALLDALKLGFREPQCKGFEVGAGRDKAGLLAQGSSACIWSKEMACSTAYQPGLSDYDFELVVDDAKVGQAQSCGERMEKVIQDHPKFKGLDVSVFIVPRGVFESAYRDVQPVNGKCGVGDVDPHGDLCLGRNGLMLKWLLEGEWVAEGEGDKRIEYSGGIDLDEVLDLLNDPVEPPPEEGGPAPEGSRRKNPHTGDWEDILVKGAERRASHVPLLEAVEWACLQDYALNAAKSRIRIKGSGIGDVPVQDPLFVKKVQKAAKAGIRAVYGRLLGSEIGNELLLEVTRDAYRGGRGCYTDLADPEKVDSLDDFDYKPCESFTEYVVSRAIESARGDLKILGKDGIEEKNNALLAWEMYRRKADVGPQIREEKAANAFLLRVMAFIDGVRTDDALQKMYKDNLAYYRDRHARTENLNACEGPRLEAVSPGGEEFLLQIPLRLYNGGFRGLVDAELAFYHDGEERRRITKILAPGESIFLAKDKTGGPEPAKPPADAPEPASQPAAGKPHYFFEVEPKVGGAHKIQFFSDPDDELAEFDKSNNYDGFYYYVLNPGASPDPPSMGRDRPEPPVELPDPPASTVCLVDGKAPPSVGLDLLATVNEQYGATLRPGGEARLAWLLRNRGNVPLKDLAIRDTLLKQPLVAGALAPRAKVIKDETYTAPKEKGPLLGIGTVRGRDPDGNGIGVTSSVTQINVGEPARAPYVRIISPRLLDPPHETSANSVPVWGIIESSLDLAKVTIGDVPAKVTRQGTKGRWFRFESSRDIELKEGLNTIDVVAADVGGNTGKDKTLVKRVRVEGLRLVKRVRSESDRKAGREPQESAVAQTGETLEYTVVVTNESGRKLTSVALEDALMDDPPDAFGLAPGQSRKVTYEFTVPKDIANGRMQNRVQATGLADGGWLGDTPGDPTPVGPVIAGAEVLLGDLTLEPGIILLGYPDKAEDNGEDPKKNKREVSQQLKVTYIDKDTGLPNNVTAKAKGTRYEYLSPTIWDGLTGKSGGTANWMVATKEVLNWLWKRFNRDKDKDEKNKEAIKIATLEVTAEGKLIAKTPGLNVVRAFYEKDGKTYKSAPSLVIVGLVELDKIELSPHSFLTSAVKPVVGLTEWVNQAIRSNAKEGEKLLDPFMLLGQSGPTCNTYFENAFKIGFSRLSSVQFKFLAGPSDVYYIKSKDIMEAAKWVVGKVTGKVASWLSKRHPVAFVLVKLFRESIETAAGEAFEEGADRLFEVVRFPLNLKLAYEDVGEDAPITLRHALVGWVTAKHSGWKTIKAKLDLSTFGLGDAEGELLVIVLPDIESAEVRRGALMVPKGQSEVAVPLRAKGKGVTDVVLSVGKRVQRRTVAVGEAPAGARDSFLVPEVGFRILRVPMLANAAEDTPVALSFSKQGVVELAEDVVPMEPPQGRGGRTVPDRVLTFVKAGYRPGELKDLTSADLPENMRKALLALLEVMARTGKIENPVMLLKDTPEKGVGNVSFGFKLDLSELANPKLQGFEIGFAAPNLVPTYQPMKDAAGKGRDDVARLKPLSPHASRSVLKTLAQRMGMAPESATPEAVQKELDASAGSFSILSEMKARLWGYVTLSRQVEGLSPGSVHLGAESCFPLLGKATDLYSPDSNAGGAVLRVREGPDPQDPSCTTRDAATHGKKPFRMTLKGHSPDGHKLVFSLVEPPKAGKVKGLPKRTGLGVATVTYTPDPVAYKDGDFFAYQVNDGERDSQRCYVLVEEINEKPRPEPAVKVHPKSPFRQIVPSVMAGMDPDGDPLKIQVVSPPVQGAYALGALTHAGKRTELSFSFVPDGKNAGPAGIGYAVSDHEYSASGEVRFEVNHPPVCRDQTVVQPITRGGELRLGLLVGDQDDPLDKLEVEVRNGPVKGGFDAKTRIYKAASDARPGTDGFSYRVFDGMDRSEVCSVVLTINERPRAFAQSLVVQRNVKDYPITLKAKDEEHSVLEFKTPNVTKWGGLSGPQRTGPQQAVVLYTPISGRTGRDMFAFEVKDTGGLTAKAAVDIRINRPPIAVKDEAVTMMGRPVVIDAMQNDEDSDGYVVLIAGVDAISGAQTRVMHPNESPPGEERRTRILFEPHPDAVGEFEFEYLIGDNDKAYSAGEIKVTVYSVNAPPVARNDGDTVTAGLAADLDVLDNDQDPDGDVLSIIDVQRPLNGEIQNLGDRIRYLPDVGYIGSDTFEYTVGDGRGGSARARVGVYVKPPS